MGAAKESFDKKRTQENKIYDIAAQMIELLEALPKDAQRRIFKLIDDQLNITPSTPSSYFPFDH